MAKKGGRRIGMSLGWAYKKHPEMSKKKEERIRANMGIGYIDGIERMGDIPMKQISYIRAKLLQIMMRRGVSMRELSEVTGMRYQTLLDYFNDRVDISSRNLERIMWALELVIMVIDKDVFDFADFTMERRRIMEYRAYKSKEKIKRDMWRMDNGVESRMSGEIGKKVKKEVKTEDIEDEGVSQDE